MTQYNISLINPKSILEGEILRIDGSAPPYPRRQSDDWWALWEGAKMRAYFVCKPWSEQDYGIVHLQGAIDWEGWNLIFSELESYASERGFHRVFSVTPKRASHADLVTLSFKGIQLREFPITPREPQEEEPEHADVPIHL